MSRIQQLLTLAEEELETADLLWKNDRYRACISRTVRDHLLSKPFSTVKNKLNVCDRSPI